ncbi:MAG: hypothetical protein Q9228_008051, partial [Teloschistes exilis]
MCPKRALSPSDPITTINTTAIYRSSPIEDRSSRFIAIYSPTLSAKELQAKAEFQSATHRIAAWRKPSTQRVFPSSSSSSLQQQLFTTGHDDDGEKHGGRNVENVLASMNVQGAVVVARWYGGTMLGPVRFEHIKNCARDAISQSLSTPSFPSIQQTAKRPKTEDPARRAELLRILPERDRSIAVLRGLLAEKQGCANGGEGKAVVAVEYGKMALGMLEGLERARDASIGWVLKQIEKVEAEKAGVGVDIVAAATTAEKVTGGQEVAVADEEGGKEKEKDVQEPATTAATATPPP